MILRNIVGMVQRRTLTNGPKDKTLRDNINRLYVAKNEDFIKESKEKKCKISVSFFNGKSTFLGYLMAIPSIRIISRDPN